MLIVFEEVEHSLFGKGRVISQDAGILSIQFSGEYGVKQFIYPEVFEKFLRLSNQELEISVQEEIHAKQIQIQTEKNRRYQEAEMISGKKKLVRNSGESGVRRQK